MFGSPETTTGGKALKFYASVRMDIRRIGQIKDGTETIGNRTRIKVVKNKVAPPFREVEFDIMYNEGVSRSGDLIDLAVTKEIIKKGGAWFTYEDYRVQGRDGLKKLLEDTPELFEEILSKVKEAMGILPEPSTNGVHKEEKKEEKKETKAKEKAEANG